MERSPLSPDWRLFAVAVLVAGSLTGCRAGAARLGTGRLLRGPSATVTTSREFLPAGIREVAVEADAGDVTFSPSETGRIEVHLRVTASGRKTEAELKRLAEAIGVRAEVRAGKVEVRVEARGEKIRDVELQTAVTVAVPNGLRNTARGDGCRITAQALEGAFSLTTGTGSILLADARGAVDATVRQGDAEVFTHDSGGQPVSIQVDAGQLSFQGKAKKFTGRVKNGLADVILDTMPDQTSIQVDTGDVELSVPPPVEVPEGVSLTLRSARGQIDPYDLNLSDLPRPVGKIPTWH
ncbi:MAG: hypothetical protein FJX77_14485, partial [Armatimonadetes bacterium]|nr:hypothetical protein [Armatimonadota bacterium]